jgi:hypothetical protein
MAKDKTPTTSLIRTSEEGHRMDKVARIEEETVQDTVVPFLKLASDNTDKDWLSQLEVGTAFVCRDKKKKEVDLQLYIVIYKGNRMVRLEFHAPDRSIINRYVDPVLFSEQHELFEILGVQTLE